MTHSEVVTAVSGSGFRTYTLDDDLIEGNWLIPPTDEPDQWTVPEVNVSAPCTNLPS